MIKQWDVVTLKGKKTRALVRRLSPMQHWPGCVEVDPPLGGYKYWDVSELEKTQDQNFKY